jgi:membrane-associated phospholipid phosphatase
LGDWAVAALLVAQAFVIPVYCIQPLQRFIPPNDPSTSYPHVDVFLTEAQKWAVLAAAPLLSGLAVNAPALLSSSSPADAAIDVHHLSLAAFQAFAIEASFKKWANLVGRPRPDYNWRVAQGKDVTEGLFAYPSGHAAEFFAVGTVLFLYFLGKARLLDATAPVRRWGGHLGLAALSCAPLAVATLVSLSRVAGYRHSFSDVNAGAGIGLLCGVFGYLLNYASPLGEGSGEARVGARAGGGRRRKAAAEGGERAPLLGAEEGGQPVST